MFIRDTRGSWCKFLYMEAKQLQRLQSDSRAKLAYSGLQLHDALQLVAARKAELREAVISAAARGITEVEIARLAGVSRPTVRDWLGKKT